MNIPIEAMLYAALFDPETSNVSSFLVAPLLKRQKFT
jgi:hypothetical protein